MSDGTRVMPLMPRHRRLKGLPVNQMAQAHTLAVSGLSDQSDLLAFVSALETAPGVRGIGLMHASDSAGVFSVLTSSRDDLVEACRHVPGFVVGVPAHGTDRDVLEITVAREVIEPAPPPMPRPASRPRYTLLSDEAAPPRSRLPVFGRRPVEGAAEATDVPGGAPEYPSTAGPTLTWHALDEAIEAVLTTGGPSRGTEPPWPPVQVDVFAPPLDVEVTDREVVYLVAAPLRSFGQVNAFRDRLAELDGVIGLQVGRFYRGALQVTVDYAGATPLFDRLQGLREFTPRALRRRDAHTIEVTLPG